MPCCAMPRLTEEENLTYARTAHGDDAKALEDSSYADNPRHADEKDDAKDILHAWEVDAG